MDYLRPDERPVRGGIADGRPSLTRDIHLAEAILALSGTTNGGSPSRAGRSWSSGPASGWPTWRRSAPGSRSRFADTQVQPRAVITSPEWSGSEKVAGATRRSWSTSSATSLAHADRTDALLPRPRVDARVRRGAAGLPAAPELRPPLRRPGRARGGRPEITVRYLTPHSKWSIHSEYQDNLHMLRLFRGGPVIWMSPVDAAKIEVARQRLDRGLQPQRRGRLPGRGHATGCRRAPCSCTTPRTGT